MHAEGQQSRYHNASASRDSGVPTLARLNHAVLLVCLSCVLTPTSLRAETLEDQVRAMHSEIERLHQEIEALREEVRRVNGARTSTEMLRQAVHSEEGTAVLPSRSSNAPETQEEQAPSPSEVVPMLQAQVAEQAQTKVESNSRLPVKFFGAVVASTFFNSGAANWPDIPNLVGVPAGPALSGGSFNFSLRQSRLGAIVQGVTVGSLKATGFFGLDFYGGNPSGLTIGAPRILYAYLRLEGEHSALEVGQDEMILAPKNPTSLAALAVPDLFRSGNLYLRVPQVRLEHTLRVRKRSELLAVGGILAPVGAYGFYDTYSLGRSRFPAGQARLAWLARPGGPGEQPAWEVGVSGHYGRERTTAGLTESWASALDFDVRTGRLGFGGEGFVGRNMGALGGSLGQFGKSVGGYLEGRLRATRRLGFNAGYGTDHLFDRLAYPTPLIKNESIFANAIYQFTPELQASFEYRWLATTPNQGPVRYNNLFDIVFAYSF